MTEFVGESIEVQTAEGSPRPVSFRWRGETHIVAEVLDERVDTGFGSLPVHSRVWYNRRHRRYFDVKDTNGDVFEMYMDYARRTKPTWWLVKKRERVGSD
jgi:hypothetical protein